MQKQQQTLDRIVADFGKLGMHGPGHEDEIDLGTAESANLAGHDLHEGALLQGYYMGLEAAVLAMSKLSTLSGMRPTTMDPRDLAWQVINFFNGPLDRWLKRRQEALRAGRPGERYWEHAPMYEPPS